MTVGRLAGADAAPPHGEVTLPVAATAGFVVEQILSGRLDAPQDYDQDHDEWVVVLTGAAVLEVAGVVHELRERDWCLLPAHTVHRLVSTEPGTKLPPSI